MTVTYVDSKRVLLASLGKKASVESVRKATTAAVVKLRALKLASAEFELPAVEGVLAPRVAEVLAQAALLSNYSFDVSGEGGWGGSCRHWSTFTR